jgi:hypothetical protein
MKFWCAQRAERIFVQCNVWQVWDIGIGRSLDHKIGVRSRKGDQMSNDKGDTIHFFVTKRGDERYIGFNLYGWTTELLHT